ncbi:MAG: hypothetical protein GWP59_07040 [Chlamydiales bacterium]|nr:hypothetical protein [Chlamydiales bacterium]
MKTSCSYLHILWKTIKELLYPQDCIHCKSYLEPNEKWLCSSCIGLVEFSPIDASSSHYICFLENEMNNTFKKQALCGGDLYGFYQAVAAFVFYQYNTLGWELPSTCLPLRGIDKEQEKLNVCLHREFKELLGQSNMRQDTDSYTLYIAWSLKGSSKLSEVKKNSKIITIEG